MRFDRPTSQHHPQTTPKTTIYRSIPAKPSNRSTITNHRNTNTRAVAPAVGTVMLVAVIALAAGATLLAFGELAEPPPEPTPSITWEVSWIEQFGGPQLELVHGGGDTAPATALTLVGDDLERQFTDRDRWSADWPATVAAGDRAHTVEAGGLTAETYHVVWEPVGAGGSIVIETIERDG